MLTEASAGDHDALDGMVRRRLAGEPVEWIVGWAPFCGLRVRVAPGVYVPRVQTELLARRAVELLPRHGVAVDVATGSGAIALVLQEAVVGARVIGTEIEPLAVACARSNGVEVVEGDLFGSLPGELRGDVDVVTANVPYVPTRKLGLLPRDVRDHEPRAALDGGADGLAHVRRVITGAPTWLRSGGHLLVEIGSDQAVEVAARFVASGYEAVHELADEDGLTRAIEGRLR